MKHLLPFLFLLFAVVSTHAQTADTSFSKQWKTIDSLINETRLPKTALVKVNKIYDDAKRRDMPAQVIRALLYKIRMQDETTETSINEVVAGWNKEIASTKNILQQCVLQVMLAKTLEQYFDNNYYRIAERSETVNFKKADITTWSKNDFLQSISSLYQNILTHAVLLQQANLVEYSGIIIKGNVPQLRPTMYDLLANMAIGFYTQNAIRQTKPENAFTLSDSIALAPANEFIAHSFVTTDTGSFLLKALQLYQHIVQFHTKLGDTAALLDADINRISWVYNNAFAAYKETQYTKALTYITQKYTNHPQAAQAWYLLVKQINDKASYDAFGDTTHRYDFVREREIMLKRLAAQPAASEGNSNMEQLLRQIEAKLLMTNAEAVNVPGQPLRVLVMYSNIDTLYGRIINKKLLDKITREDESKYWRSIAALPYFSAFTQYLPATNDYRQHKVEIKISALPAGEYTLLGGNTKTFDAGGKLLRQDFKVSHLSYIHKGEDYFVVDRESGQPLAGIKVAATIKYNDDKGNEKTKVLPVITTPADGRFKVPAMGKNRMNTSINIKLTDGSDVLENEDYNERYYEVSTDNDVDTTAIRVDYEKEKASVTFYTDRAIYRPGQKLFFKGIAITQDKFTANPKVYTSKDKVLVYLTDATGKTGDSVWVSINEYGSFTGFFNLPAQGLTGQFTLTLKGINGDKYVRVEEYKRPTFYVQVDTLKSAYRLREAIDVSGFAQAFAGNFLNNVAVKYTVQRTTQYAIFDWSFRRYPRSTNPTQIAEGTVKSGGDGKFSISFPALPDETADTASNPTFNFEVGFSVTDAGGETREAKTTISVGYTSLLLKLSVPTMVEKNAFNVIPIVAQNQSGKPVETTVHVNMYDLQPPGRAVRKRYWLRPDVFAMGKEEFVKNFPYDEYENESDPHTWQRDTAVVNDTISTTGKGYNVKPLKLAQGWYVIEVSATDKDGRAIKNIAYTEVYDAATANIPAGDENFNVVENLTVQPGKTAVLIAGSAFNDVYMLKQVERRGQKNETVTLPVEVVNINNNKKRIEEQVTESDRGGLGIYYAFVKHNRFYTGNAGFDVPYDNKQLGIEYTSFRNKTEPGSKEQWTVQVKGIDSTKKAAELLTAMYDASLDEFAANTWTAPDIWPYFAHQQSWEDGGSFYSARSNENYVRETYIPYVPVYDNLAVYANDFWQFTYRYAYNNNGNIYAYSQRVARAAIAQKNGGFDFGMGDTYAAAPLQGGRISENFVFNELNPPKHMKWAPILLPDLDGDGIADQFDLEPNTPAGASVDSHGRSKGGAKGDEPTPHLRTNFNETAFFFPQLYPDSAGNYTIQFTMPESLTKWKWMNFAHTKDLAFGSSEQTIITQKTLMVQPSMPRFLREGDALELTARISNTGDTAFTGQAELQLIDAGTGKPVDGLFHNVFPNQYFTAEAGQTTVVKFPVAIPFNYTRPLTYRILAKTTGFNDGEENTLPVLTNRMLVTESLPLYIKGDTARHFTFDKLLNNNSETLQTQSLTVEYTPNPVWNAIQALPYLMEYPYECAEQTFNRFYANALSSYIIQQHPRIKEVFGSWLKDSAGSASALLSNLEKNPELKQVLLAETPWVLDAENETQQKKNIALLFDVAKMADGAQSALQKLRDMQMDNGAFAWFKGGYADRYITQYILTGIGRLQQMHAVPAAEAEVFSTMISKALTYLDKEANNDYSELIKNKADMQGDNLSQTAIQYLYMRSYFTTVPVHNKTAYNYYYQQAMKYWAHQSEYMQGMISMTLLRTNQRAYVLGKIYPAIIENAVATKERGMYWKNAVWGYYWYQAPIEQQALLIELAESLQKKSDADEMRTWLINQKQTTNWKTTKATADACFALLLNNGTMVDANRNVTIQLGGYTISNTSEKEQAGTGYFKKVLPQQAVMPAMGNVTVTVQTPGSTIKNTSPSYGAVYWQYFEDMDKITGAATSLSLHKKLFVEHNTAAGRVLTPVNDDSVLHVGDKVIMRVEMKTDRNLEYIHLKDTRAAAMEPVNVLSEYKWQDGLGYYESTKDASTDFFISYMQQGTYVFEYPVYITHTGTFSAGIATVQCMYAPEFSSHSEGVKITVE